VLEFAIPFIEITDPNLFTKKDIDSPLISNYIPLEGNVTPILNSVAILIEHACGAQQVLVLSKSGYAGNPPARP